MRGSQKKQNKNSFKQIWVADTQQISVAKECHRQSKLIHDDIQEEEILKWISFISTHKGWL